MKRTVMLVLGCIFALGLFSCGSDDNDDDEYIAILVNDAETVSAAATGDLLILRLSNGVPADWSVSDTSVATLSAASGVSVCLIAQAAGDVTVTATAGGMRYTRALQITAKDGTPNGGETNAPNVTFTNLSAYKVIVCRDGLGAEVATIAAGATTSVYVSPGATEIMFHFRYSYCVIDDADSGMVWLNVADSTAYTYPVDSADIAQGAVQVRIPAPKNPQFSSAYLKVANLSDTPVSLYNGNTQQKLYGQEKYYIQPGHSGVYSIPPDAPFDGFTLGENTASATAIAPFYAVSGVLYQCTFSEDCAPITATEKDWLRESFTVTFETNGGSTIPPLTASLLETTLIPATTREGYYFAGWYTDQELQRPAPFPCVMTADTTLYAKWLGNTNTAYAVRHFLQNTDRSTYTLQDTEPLAGTTEAATIATAKSYRGFTARPFAQETISPDGTTVVNIYYDRNAYTVTFNANDGTDDTQAQTFYYGVAKKLDDNMFYNPGYVFLGWATSQSGNPVYKNEADFLIDGQNPADVMLYAVWIWGIVVTAATAESIDLSDITDEYTIKVVGNITQSTLKTLADKIKTTKALINLNLSEATGLIAIGAASVSTSIFAGCPLNSLALPKTLEVIGSYAFAKCSIKYVTIPASVQTILNYAFSYCPNLESVEIDGAETVKYFAFSYCESLKTVTLKNINVIGESVFAECTNLSSVTMEAVGTIGDRAFSSCTSLSFITIDAESIGGIAFGGCTSLTGVVIGKNVKSIDNTKYVDTIKYSCFTDCSQLTSVQFEDTENWYYVDSSNRRSYIDVTDATTNASNLQSVIERWYKE